VGAGDLAELLSGSLTVSMEAHQEPDQRVGKPPDAAAPLRSVPCSTFAAITGGECGTRRDLILLEYRRPVILAV